MALHSTRTQVVTADSSRWLNVPDACLKKLCSQNYKTIKALKSRNLEAAIGCLDCHSVLSLQTGRVNLGQMKVKSLSYAVECFLNLPLNPLSF